MAQRRDQVTKTCSKYGSRLKIPLKLYNKKLRWCIKVVILMFYQPSDWTFRFDVKHRIMYCENYKVKWPQLSFYNPKHLIQIGSSTWATHLLKMNNVPIYRKTPIHIVSRQHFPPLLGRRKEAFLKNAESFIVARDPFERLLSSFKVGSKYVIFFAMIKCVGDHLRTNSMWPFAPTWWHGPASDRSSESSNINTGTRRGRGQCRHSGSLSSIWWDLSRQQRRWLRHPDIQVGELSPSSRNMKKMTRMINEHWKPVYLNCAPCSER